MATSMSINADTTNFVRATLTAETFLNKSCAIYGRSGSGKSTIIKHILYLLRGYVPTTIVFSLSEKNNSAYSKAYVPRCLVHDTITEDVIQEIAVRQTRSRKIYDRANRIETLDKLFARVANDNQRRIRMEIQKTYDELASKRPIDEETENVFREKLIAFFHKVIDPVYHQLEAASSTFGEEERFALNWFQFNPRVTIVFDDCSTELQRLRNCAEALEQIFQGRHGFYTTIMAVHTEVCLAPSARSNITLAFYTDQQTAKQFAERKTNAFNREKRTEIIRYADQIRATTPPTPPFTKMFYASDQPTLVEVPIHEPFSAVSPEMREFCELLAKKNSGNMESWMKNLI